MRERILRGSGGSGVGADAAGGRWSGRGSEYCGKWRFGYGAVLREVVAERHCGGLRWCQGLMWGRDALICRGLILAASTSIPSSF